MTLAELFGLIEASTGEDWTHLVERQDSDPYRERAAFVRDLSVGLAWGRRDRENFVEAWIGNVDNSPSRTNPTEWVAVLYNGSPVEEVLRVIVDGHECGLPVPDPQGRVTRARYELMRVVDEIERGHTTAYADYFRRTGLLIID